MEIKEGTHIMNKQDYITNHLTKEELRDLLSSKGLLGEYDSNVIVYRNHQNEWDWDWRVNLSNIYQGGHSPSEYEINILGDARSLNLYLDNWY
jgi:DNA-binding transcriptional regulator PaaX